MGSSRATTGPFLVVGLSVMLLAGPRAGHGESQPSPRAQALLLEAREAIRTEDFAAAEQLLRAAIAADPQSPEGTCTLGQTYMAIHRYREAAESLGRCKALILNGLRRAQSEQNRSYARIEEQIRDLRETLQAIQSGQVKSAGSDRVIRIEARIRELEQEKLRDPVRVEVPAAVTLALGTAYLRADLLEEAEGELLEAIGKRPEAGDVHNNLAAVYLAQGRWAEATEQIALAEEKGFAVDPQMKADVEARRLPVRAAAPALPPPSSREPDVEAPAIRHEVRSCAVRGAFPRIEAGFDVAALGDSPVVRFRTEKAAGWYSMVMLPAGGDRYAVYLPKPRSATRFEYFIQIGDTEEPSARADEVSVRVFGSLAECAEASSDPSEAGSVLVVSVPPGASEDDPVPPGFSIRGTTADIGVLEMRSKKALVAGLLGLGGAAAGALAMTSGGPTEYSGPRPFEEAPGLAFVSSTPPLGSTLSLTSGFITMELRVFSIHAMAGARITATLHVAGVSSHCISISGVHDLEAGRTTSIVIGGPTRRDGPYCPIGTPLEELRVRVTESTGLGGFLTGVPGLPHLRVSYWLEE